MATGFRNLLVYQKGFSLAMDIFEMIKAFPKEEQFDEYNNRSIEIGKLLNDILNNPQKYS
ncbi:MAG: four helix bundle protein [Bacteroidales bacterium]|nr:four helix bundle protein [Bacteroidales bacterium]MCF6342825.1 four helix bundle protein [Bacteroidales bacterium]